MTRHFNGSLCFTLTEHGHYVVKMIVINCMALVRFEALSAMCGTERVGVSSLKGGFGTAGVFGHVTLFPFFLR